MKPLKEGDRVMGFIQWENVLEGLLIAGVVGIVFGAGWVAYLVLKWLAWI